MNQVILDGKLVDYTLRYSTDGKPHLYYVLNNYGPIFCYASGSVAEIFIDKIDKVDKNKDIYVSLSGRLLDEKRVGLDTGYVYQRTLKVSDHNIIGGEKNMNNISLVGRLTKDPEMRTVGENSYARFILAVNRNLSKEYKERLEKEGKQTVDFIPVYCTNGIAKSLVEYKKKGDLVGVSGRLESRDYLDKDNKRVFVTEIRANNIEFL